MTKQEALQLFASHVDVSGLTDDFPDLDWVATELEDGQQEIIVRLQGEDSDFRPAVDLAAIEAMTRADLPDGSVINETVLRKYKRKMIRSRKLSRDIALLKRIKSLIAPAGVSLRRIAKVIRHNIPAEEIE
jgi:hypothetical protein